MKNPINQGVSIFCGLVGQERNVTRSVAHVP